jgi:hypothetical protein
MFLFKHYDINVKEDWKTYERTMQAHERHMNIKKNMQEI